MLAEGDRSMKAVQNKAVVMFGLPNCDMSIAYNWMIGTPMRGMGKGPSSNYVICDPKELTDHSDSHLGVKSYPATAARNRCAP
jgi:hypothetical protein